MPSITPKFMQTLDDFIYKELEKIAKKRGITIQELIRAVIVPEWMNGHGSNGDTPSSGVTKDPSTRVNNWR